MSPYTVGCFVGSLATASINRTLSKALIRLAPPGLVFVEIQIRDLPLYSYDYDAAYPPEGRALKEAIAAVDAVLFVTPEYNRSLPGAPKNAIDWASRPWGTSSFAHKPSAVIGASPGALGTAAAQQSLRSILSFCNSSPDERPGGVHPVQAWAVHRRRRGDGREHRAVPPGVHGGVRDLHHARAQRPAAPNLTEGTAWIAHTGELTVTEA
jgi:chromate reductase, NAD(P)H dehydrogenase (quinone)